MALEEVRRILRKHNYEACMTLDEDRNVSIWFPARKQHPMMKPELTTFRYSPENIFVSVHQEGDTKEGNLDIAQFAFRTLTFVKALANCVKWSYPKYLLGLKDCEGNYISENEFYNQMLPFKLDERLSEEDKAFNIFVTRAINNNFPSMFDELAEEHEFLKDYNYTKNLYFNTIGEKP